MKIEVEWSAPILLAKNNKVMSFEAVRDNVPQCPGVYFFSRRFGETSRPFYIGRSSNLRHRLRAHLKKASIQDILRGDKNYGDLALNGRKYFHYGVIKTSSNNKVAKSLPLIEKYLIQQALSKNIVLLNISLTTIHAHEIIFSGDNAGRSIYPAQFAIREK